MNEETARNLLPVNVDNSIGPNYGHYMAWSPSDDTITLDSKFTLEELEALVWWMRNKNSPSSPTAEASDLKSDQCEFKSRGGEIQDFLKYMGIPWNERGCDIHDSTDNWIGEFDSFARVRFVVHLVNLEMLAFLKAKKILMDREEPT